MASQNVPTLSRFCYFTCLALFLGVTSTVLLESQATHDETTVATYSRGTLHTSIPYHAPHAGAGQLTVEVLDPEDKVLGRSQHDVNVSDGKGWWQEQVSLEKVHVRRPHTLAADRQCLRCGIDSSHCRSVASELDSPLPGPARQLQRPTEGREPL